MKFNEKWVYCLDFLAGWFIYPFLFCSCCNELRLDHKDTSMGGRSEKQFIIGWKIKKLDDDIRLAAGRCEKSIQSDRYNTARLQQ